MAKKSVRPFSYDSVDTFFDVVPPEGRKEILLLECKESGVAPITLILNWLVNI